MSLGKFIAVRRKHMLMTQEDLAAKMNVSKSAIAKWETDRGIPDRDNLYMLADIMDVPVEDLHRMIRSKECGQADINVNITSDVIEILESYGYKVTRDQYKGE